MKQILLLISIVFTISIAGLAQQDTTKKKDPRADRYYNSAMELLQQKQYEQAIQYLDSSYQITPDDVVLEKKPSRISSRRNMPNP
jgi:outer membrane protein assembly factor BamD (BamD/ComL family)